MRQSTWYFHAIDFASPVRMKLEGNVMPIRRPSRASGRAVQVRYLIAIQLAGCSYC